ncbi:hypothetical protein HDU96_003571, partial [Phlyctochytrium bullatum]
MDTRDPTLPASLKLLDRFFAHQQSWEASHDLATLHLSAIANQLHQRSSTLELHRTHRIPLPLVLADPHIVSKLVARQMGAVEEAIEGIEDAVVGMEKTVAAMGAVRREAVAKAQVAFAGKNGEEGAMGMGPVAVEAASWIDGLVAGYERETTVLRMLVGEIKVG